MMKAAVMTAPLHIEIQDRPAPEPGPYEVLVSMKAAGICGSDVHFYTGDHPYANYPQIFGHELSGVVAKTGSKSARFKQGDRVVIDPAMPCGTCYPCRIGKANCCLNMDFIGAFRPGGFAELVLAPAKNILPLPDGMTHAAGALCEPFTIGAQIVSRAEIRPGSTVTLLGAGPIGLTALIWLKQKHDVRVMAVDVLPERLEKARIFGADAILNPRERDPIRAVEEWTGGEGANVVIEAAGLKLTMEQAIHMVSPGGRIVIAGLTRDDVSYPGILFTKKEVEILGSRNSVNQFPETIRFLEQNPGIAQRFISHTLPFTRIPEAMHVARTQQNQVTKLILDFTLEDGGIPI